MKYLTLILLLSCGQVVAQKNSNLRGPDSSAYTIIKWDQCMCQEPQFFLTMRTPKGDTIKFPIMVIWDTYSSYWENKMAGKHGHITKYMKPGKKYWMRPEGYFFNEDYIFKIHKN